MSVRFKYIEDFNYDKCVGQYYDSFIFYPNQESKYFNSFRRYLKIKSPSTYDIEDAYVFIAYDKKNRLHEKIIRKNLGSMVKYLKSTGQNIVYPELYDKLFDKFHDEWEKYKFLLK